MTNTQIYQEIQDGEDYRCLWKPPEDKCFKSETPLPSYCFFNDDMNGLINQYVAADGIIIATPVYVTTVSGLLKDFMDRMQSYLFLSAHRQQNVFKNMPCVGGVSRSGATGTAARSRP